MLFVVIAMTIATVAVAAIYLAPRLSEERIIFDVMPDRPAPFGYKMAWLAVRARDPAEVAAALALEAPEAANWASGLGAVYDARLGEKRVFVSPAVNGWVFVVGLALPAPIGRRFSDKSAELLLRLGQRFAEVQYFSSHPLVDHFAWARVLEGRLARAFAIGDEGVIWNKGRPTKEEKGLGLKLFELRGVRGRSGDAGGEILIYPTEQHIMQLAAKWSIDPTSLGMVHASHGVGLVAEAPAAWRPELAARKAAA